MCVYDSKPAWVHKTLSLMLHCIKTMITFIETKSKSMTHVWRRSFSNNLFNHWNQSPYITAVTLPYTAGTNLLQILALPAAHMSNISYMKYSAQWQCYQMTKILYLIHAQLFLNFIKRGHGRENFVLEHCPSLDGSVRQFSMLKWFVTEFRGLLCQEFFIHYFEIQIQIFKFQCTCFMLSYIVLI
jgi:hypothetical protein